MKKILLIHLGKFSYRTIAYIFLSLIFTSVLFYSCRKLNSDVYNPHSINPAAVMTKSDLLNWYDQLSVPAKTDLNAEDGLVSAKGKLPFVLQWNKAQQRIINGKHVVKVPIAASSVMMFVKEGANGPIHAYAYKMYNKAKNNQAFSGSVFGFSFQDFTSYVEAVTNGRVTQTFKYPLHKEIPVTQMEKLKTSLNAIKTQTGSIRTNTLKTNSWIGDLLEDIGQVFEALGCVLSGDSWQNDYPDGNFFGITGDLAGCRTDDGGGDQQPVTGYISDGEYFAAINFTISVGGGSSSGGSSSGGSSYNSFSDLSASFWSQFMAMGGGFYNPTLIKIDLDSLNSLYPCAAKIITQLKDNDSTYKTFINGFLGNGIPTMHWKAKSLAWNTTGGGIEFGKTTSQIGSQSTYNYLNTNMLQNSSKLLITATIIHESVHSAVHYYLNNAYLNIQTDPRISDTLNYLMQMNAYIELIYFNDNATTHTQMLTKYFKQMVKILKAAQPGLDDKVYAEALLLGTDNPGPNASPSTISKLQADYNSIKTLYGIQDSDMTAFKNANVVTTNPADKLPTICN